MIVVIGRPANGTELAASIPWHGWSRCSRRVFPATLSMVGSTKSPGCHAWKTAQP